jgi:hypothetical protein
MLLDHARNAGIGSSCESRQRAPCWLLYKRPRPKYKPLRSSVATTRRQWRREVAGLRRRRRVIDIGGDGRPCEQDRSPLKRRNRLPTNEGDKATPRLNAGGTARIALRNLRACNPRRRAGSRPNPTSEILCMGLFFEKHRRLGWTGRAS